MGFGLSKSILALDGLDFVCVDTQPLLVFYQAYPCRFHSIVGPNLWVRLLYRWCKTGSRICADGWLWPFPHRFAMGRFAAKFGLAQQETLKRTNVLNTTNSLEIEDEFERTTLMYRK